MKKIICLIFGLLLFPGQSIAVDLSTPLFNNAGAFIVARSVKLGTFGDSGTGNEMKEIIGSEKEMFECSNDTGCSATQRCVANKCQDACAGNTCAQGTNKKCLVVEPHSFKCVACLDTEANTCGTGKKCMNNTCVDACTGLTCAAGKKCSNGTCVNCTSGEQCNCPTGQIATGSGSCKVKPECTSSDQCSNDKFCCTSSSSWCGTNYQKCTPVCTDDMHTNANGVRSTCSASARCKVTAAHVGDCKFLECTKNADCPSGMSCSSLKICVP